MAASVQDQMQRLLESLVKSGPNRGLQLCAYLDGVRVVDAWAGVADNATGRPVAPDTLFPVFSVTKGLTAAVVHILAERGLLRYDEPIARLWPEFGAEGKGGITLRHGLSHQAGLPLLPAGLGPAELCRWETVCAAIAALRPVSAPGEVMTYHAATFGWILGEPARRAAGLPFGKLIEREIKAPLGLSDLYVGIPEGVEDRIATAYDAGVPGAEPPPPPTDPTSRDILAWMNPLGTFVNRPDVRRACMPGVNGIMTARDLASFYAALLPGGRAGQRLLSPERLREATRQQALQQGPEFPIPRRMGLGYFLGGEGCPELGGNPDAFGHGGYGGSLGCADPASGLAVGFTKNLLQPGDPVRVLVMQELRSALGLPG